MKYLIKDLSRITGLSPARIRKWQERFGILDPDVAPNGYHYYSNDDLFVLQNIRRQLEAGGQLERLTALGRAGLLALPVEGQFTPTEWSLLQLVAEARFAQLGRQLLSKKRGLTVGTWNAQVLGPLCELVGRGWEAGVISVADEHAFSRWFIPFYFHALGKNEQEQPAQWLVVSHPEDEHELGALLHYGRLRDLGVPVRFCGRLPEPELLRELQTGDYRTLSISTAVPRPERALLKLRARVQQRFAKLRVLFGGWGWRNRIRAAGRRK